MCFSLQNNAELPPAKAWVQRVAERVTEHIDGEHNYPRAIAGAQNNQGAWTMKRRPSLLSMPPQESVGGGTP